MGKDVIIACDFSPFLVYNFTIRFQNAFKERHILVTNYLHIISRSNS